jgi:ABC-type antimicrobial peptide transport system permease subunit
MFFGGGFMGTADLGEIPSFGPLREAVESLPEVKAILPMGMMSTTVSSGGNRIDQTISAMRAASQQNDRVQFDALQGRLLAMAKDITLAQQHLLTIAQETHTIKEALQHLTVIQSDAFWERFQKNPETGLQYLESHIAKLGETAQTTYFRNLGTDFSRFPQFFDRFEIVKGQPVPDNHRGYLISSRWYEERLKNRVAREFDRIHKNKTLFGKTIASDADLKSRAERLPRQYRRITYELTPKNALKLDQELSALLPDVEGDLQARIKAFLTLNDSNFDRRYSFFYKTIAPMLRLYWFNIGDTITLRAVTQAGYYKALNVKFFGTYRFKGLEESDLAGAFNLIDLLSFRELYGVMTEGMKAELSAIRSDIDIVDVDQDNIEDALFGDPDEASPTAVSDTSFEATLESLTPHQSDISHSFDPAEINQGLALNAAVILHDFDRIEEVQQKIEALGETQGLNIQTTDWAAASGIVGQLITLIRVVIYIAIAIIFLVAMVIINNSMVMATNDRTPEIGTMRAIGAHRRFVMQIFIIETLLLGSLSGLLGAIASVAGIAYLGHVGIPAPAEFFVFLFSGDRLYPTLRTSHLLLGVASVVLISVVSTIYPARIATRVEPVVAMQGRD